MPEKSTHRRAKNRAAGPGGRTEVPLRGKQRLDALTKGGGRATEVERSGSSAGLNAAAQRLKKSGAPQKGLQVPQKDMGGAANPDREPPPPDAGPDPEGYRLNFRNETETYIAFRRLEVPVIAMINGPCVGAGFDLASHCDLAVGSTAARYQVAYVKRGVFADLGGFWSLPKILGWRKAMELMMTGRFMSAEEAHESGLTNYLVEPDELEARTMELALDVEAGPPIAQKLGKMLALRTAHMDFDTAMQWSESAIPVVGLSKDSIEGMRAFADRRETDFKGY